MSNFGLPEYDQHREWIRNARNRNMKWEEIDYAGRGNDEGLSEFLTQQSLLNFWKEVSCSEWKELVRLQKEAEEQRKREKLENCDNLIKEAKRLLGKKNYKSALAKAEEAKAIGLHERADEIGELIAEIKREKDDNNPFRIFMKKIKEGADDIMKD